jgi:methyl coenzyme M reductase subunit C-like uncharacterized protein (methanogenesis marker protein 7)
MQQPAGSGEARIVRAAPVSDELRRRRQIRALRKLIERAALLEAEERHDLAR